MEKKKILILGGIFLLLLLIVLMLDKSDKPRKSKSDKYLVQIDSRKINKITIKKKDKETALVKEGDRWIVANKGKFPADPDFLADILKQFNGMKVRQIVSRNSQKINIFEVDAATGIEVKAEGENVNAHFYIGKSGSDYNSNYIRREGSDNVYLSDEFVKRYFELSEFRNRKIFDLKDREIIRLSFKFSDREIELQRDSDGSWKQTKNEPYNAKAEAVKTIVDNLKNFRIDEFIEEPDDKKFDNPHLRLSFNCEDGYENTLIVSQKDGVHFFVKSAADNYQYKVFEHQINRLTDKLKELKDIPPPPPAKVESKSEKKPEPAPLPIQVKPKQEKQAKVKQPAKEETKTKPEEKLKTPPAPEKAVKKPTTGKDTTTTPSDKP